MDRELTDLTKDEFDTLKQMGFLWELYPEAPDVFENIKRTEEDNTRQQVSTGVNTC